MGNQPSNGAPILLTQPAQKMRVKHPYIIFLKSHCGGKPIILGTKFPVLAVVYYILKQGMTPEELVQEFRHLSLSQVYDALSYYYENKAEIDQDIALHEEDLRKKTADG
jgi:uncharacterized protein (DUF433 family)